MTKKELRHKKIIDYLNSHESVSSTELLDFFGIKKSTLSEDLAELKRNGYPINTSKHGFVSLYKSETESISHYEEITESVIRKWIILYAFNLAIATHGGPVTSTLTTYISNLYRNLSPSGYSFSNFMIHKDLRELVKDGYMEYPIDIGNQRFESNEYFSTRLSPKMVIVNVPMANKILSYLKTDADNSLYKKLKKDIYELYGKDVSPSHATSQSIDDLSTAINEVITILQNDYERLCLSFTYTTAKSEEKITGFEVGSIIYSAEKNRFYILGRYQPEGAKKKIYKLFRADHINQITEMPESHNTLYNSDEINKASDLIFEGSIEEGPKLSPISVELLFVNTEQNLNRIRILTQSRQYAKYEVIPTDKINQKVSEQIVIESSNGVIRYTDEILGEKDLQRFVRGFDDEVQIIKPTNLTESLNKRKALHKLRYEQVFREEYGENINDCI